MRVENDAFIQRLAALLQTAETQGSVYLEQKRLARTGADSKLDAAEAPFSLLFRATDGLKDKSKRTKVSTIVEPKHLEAFWTQYADTLKSGMPGLLKKEKKKKK